LAESKGHGAVSTRRDDVDMRPARHHMIGVLSKCIQLFDENLQDAVRKYFFSVPQEMLHLSQLGVH